MNRLDVIEDALLALAAFLDRHGHGPACVCGPCTASAQATALLPRLEHLLKILDAWSRGEAEDPILPEDLRYVLDVVLEDDHPAEREP